MKLRHFDHFVVHFLLLLLSYPLFHVQPIMCLHSTSIYLGVDRLAHGNAGTLQCILLHTEVTPLAEGEATWTTWLLILNIYRNVWLTS